MNLAIITGGSKGLGKALVRTYCEKGFKVISISRTNSCFTHENFLNNITFDLSQIEKLETLKNKLQLITKDKEFENVILINNAGTLGNITTNQKDTAKNIDYTIKLNLTTPLILISFIINLFRNYNLSIYNISSGAASKSYYGWSNYNASKSGLSLATKTIALEQENNSTFEIFNIIPGVINTQMQKQIRNTKQENFKDVDRFINMDNENLLLNPLTVALKIYNIKTMNYKSGYTINLKHL